MAFVTAFCSVLAGILAFILQVNSVYVMFCFFISGMYVGVLLLNAYTSPQKTYFYLTAIVPIWVNLEIILLGGGFAENTAILASLAITHVVYDRDSRLKYSIMAYVIICHVAAITFSALYSPLWGTVNYPFDEIAVFMISMGWISVLLKVHEQEKDQLIRNLKSKNVELESTTEQLERFTYIASHDLKSPLRTIISFLGLMERDLKKNDISALKDHMKFAKSGALQMNYLIEDILELSTLDGQSEAAKNWIDLNEVLQKSLSNLKEDIETKDAEIMLAPLPAYLCNEVEFLLLFQNLIQNGIKYNESPIPKIDVWTDADADYTYIHFKDNGIGISKEYHDSIFDFFKRLHTSNQYQGTGIGLGLCKKIIQKYNGKITVDSQANVGTTFTIRLPLLHEKNDSLVAPELMSLTY